MIVVGIANIKQNIRILKRTGKKVFIDLAHNAYGHGITDLYQALRFDADGFIWDNNTDNLAMYTGNPASKPPLIVSRSLIQKHHYNAYSYAGATVTLKGTSDLGALTNFGSSTQLIRVMLEYGVLGFNDGELDYVIDSIRNKPEFKNLKLLGIIANDGLTQEIYDDLHSRYENIDVCGYDSPDISDIVFASEMLYGYGAPNLHKSVNIRGEILDSSYNLDTHRHTYVTDLCCADINSYGDVIVDGDVVKDTFDVAVGGARLLAFTLNTKSKTPKSVQLVRPDTFGELFNYLQLNSHVRPSYTNSPLA